MSAELIQRMKGKVAEQLAARIRSDGGRDGQLLAPTDRRLLGRQLIAEAIEEEARAAVSAGRTPMDVITEDDLAQAVFDSLFGLGGFERLLADPDIENINANGCDNVWVRYSDGRVASAGPVATSDGELVEVLRAAASRLGLSERRFDLASPRLSLQLPDGSRLFAVMAVAARPCVSIRRHRHLQLTGDDLIETGTMDLSLREFFRAAVRARKNLIICGGTGAGKTTLLRALAADIEPGERLVTIEDSLELGLDHLPGRDDVVALEAREANVEGEGAISLAELVRWALRLSPDRVIVGEVRGDEVLPMLNAMSTGNDGSMCTLHANSSRAAFGKLASYAIQAPERLTVDATNLLVANAVDFIAFLSFDRVSGRRVVSSVREVVDADGHLVVSNEVFRPGPDGMAMPGVRLRDETLTDLIGAGLEPSLLGHERSWQS